MIIRSTLFGTSLLIAAGSALAHADNIPADGSGYLKSGDNVVTTGLDGCLRSGTWSEDNQINACEGIEDEVVEEVKEEVAEVEKPAEPAEPVGKVEMLTLEGQAQFATDSSELTGEGRQAMNSLLGKLAEFKNITSMTVTGHTDDRGSDEYNQALSERRAQTVADVLGARYPDAAINVVGLGESSPIDDNGTEAGRLMNRRVEVEVEASRMIFN